MDPWFRGAIVTIDTGHVDAHRGAMTVLHRNEDIFSARHVPSWLMLTFAAGCVNATTFLACERFVTHVTGTVTRVGMEVARLAILLDFALVVACFVGGAMTSAILINARAHRGKAPLHSTPLVVVAALTAVVAVAGHFGFLGEFGGSVDQAGDFVLLSVLSFASGLQNAAVATSTGLLVRTTHLTGPATDLGIHLVEMASAPPSARTNARRHALLRSGKMIAYAVGAAAGVALAHTVQFIAYSVPAVIVAIATARSFVVRGERSDQPPHPRETLGARSASPRPARALAPDGRNRPTAQSMRT